MTAIYVEPNLTRAEPHLDYLSSEAHRLWQNQPEGDHPGREDYLTELANVDHVLERLTLRAIRNELDDTELAEIDECSRRLALLKFERHLGFWNEGDQP